MKRKLTVLVILTMALLSCTVTSPVLDDPCYRLTFWVDGDTVTAIAIDRGLPLTILTTDLQWVHPDSIAYSEWTPGECDAGGSR